MIDKDNHPLPDPDCPQQREERDEFVATVAAHASQTHTAPQLLVAAEIVYNHGIVETQKVGEGVGLGGGGEDRPADILQPAHDLPHLLLKTGLQDLVEFIEHKQPDRRQVDIVAPGMVEETSRGSHDDIGHHLQRIDLILDAVAAVEGYDPEAARQLPDHAGNLRHEFAARRDNDGLHASCRWAHKLKQRECEGDGLAAACRREEYDVALPGSHSGP